MIILFPKIAELKANAKVKMEGSLGTLYVFGLASILSTLLVTATIVAVFAIVFFWAFGIPVLGQFVIFLMVLAIALCVFFVSAAFELSFARIYLRLTDGIKPHWKDLLYGFKKIFRAAWIVFLKSIFVSAWFLAFFVPALILFWVGGILWGNGVWSGLFGSFWGPTQMIFGILFIILGVILFIAAFFIIIYKLLAYNMALFSAVENPGLNGYRAIKESIRIMKGYKSKLYELEFSFLLWIIASIVTYGLLLFYTLPYMMTTTALFYKDIKNKPVEEEEDISFASILNEVKDSKPEVLNGEVVDSQETAE